MKRLFRRLSFFLSLCMIFGMLEGMALPLPVELEASEEAPEIVRVMVLFEDAPMTAGDGLLSQEECDDISQRLEETIPELEIVYDFSELFSGVSVEMPYGQMETLRAVDGVADAWVATTYEIPALSEEGESTEAFAVLASDGFSTGEGMVIAVLDTGINLKHEAFQANEKMLGDVALTKAPTLDTPGTYVSAKIPFAYDYADKDGDVTDHNGHGSHVAGIAAGYVEESDGGVSFSGEAPGAQLAIMKVFGDDSSTTTSDVYFAALQDAWRMGVDVVNMSFGTPCGFTHDENLDTLLFGDIYEKLDDAGIIVCCAGGNNGSQGDENSYSEGTVSADYTDYGTVASPATYDGNLSVANAKGMNTYSYGLEVDGESVPYTDPVGRGGSFAKAFGGKAVDYVFVDGVGNQQDYIGVSGKIAVVSRGVLSFQEKVHNAAEAGAIGVILCNNDSTDVGLQMPQPEIPTIMVSMEAGVVLENAEEKTLYVMENRQLYTTNGGASIHSTSSWGTTSELTIDPVFSAVGTSVLSAGASGTDTYRVSTGTSMATPTVAGQMAVISSGLKAAYPNLTKKQRAELAESMAGSYGTTLGTTDAPISVRQQGAGIVDVGAVSTGSVYIEAPIQELGDDPDETGVYEMTLTLINPLLTGAIPATERFYDVYEGDWYETPVTVMSHLGVVRGTGGGGFSPVRELTRGEAVTILYRMAGEPEIQEKSTFYDVEPGAYYEDAVAWAQSEKITGGTGGNMFSPLGELTREQSIVLIYRFMGSPETKGSIQNYVDQSEVADYAQAAWCWAVETGIVVSCSVDSLVLNPQGVITRGELTTLLYRILNSAVTATYTPSVSVFTDLVTKQQDGLLRNELKSTPLDCAVSCSCGETVQVGLVPEGVSVTVTITLSDTAEGYIQNNFENGAYVEGYVYFSGDSGDIHATFLGYYGDWDEGPVLEQTDFRDVAAAEDAVRDIPGATYYDLLPVNTDANRANLYCNNIYSDNYGYTIAALGDNPFSKDAAYRTSHMAVSSGASDGDFVYADQLLVRTRSLRNARTLTYTVQNSDTGEIYYKNTLDYCSKSVYQRGWSDSSSLYWTPEDASGQPLPTGTPVTVTVSASVRGAAETTQWSFPFVIDASAPEVTGRIENGVLTVEATDQQYLAALMVVDQNGNTLAEAYYSDDESGQPHELTVALTNSASVTIYAVDYATNVRTLHMQN